MPIPILVADIEQAERIGVLDEAAHTAAAVHWPGALTLVVPRKPGLPEWIGHPESGSVGIRVPDHPITLALLAAAGPLAVTSANRSGYPPAADDGTARAALGSVGRRVPGGRGSRRSGLHGGRSDRLGTRSAAAGPRGLARFVGTAAGPTAPGTIHAS